MTAADNVFSGSIPEFYDTYMVPLIFEAFANDMAARVASFAPMSVLETAAGSGVVSRALINHLHPDARYVVTDLNQPMLDHAASRQATDKRIEWCQADALELPFEAGSFDTVICQFGAMFFPERIRGYSEARRVLKDGGRFFFSVWDRIENNEFADVVTNAAATAFPDNPPQFLKRTPHGYFDQDQIHVDLNRAGFTNAVIVSKEGESRAPSARQVAVAYCQGTPLRGEIEAREEGSLKRITDITTDALEARYGRGPVAAKICAHIVMATK
jgi:ubiquinone/menaquinone biosynthesis C-methylase UbiE